MEKISRITDGGITLRRGHAATARSPDQDPFMGCGMISDRTGKNLGAAIRMHSDLLACLARRTAVESLGRAGPALGEKGDGHRFEKLNLTHDTIASMKPALAAGAIAE